MRAVVLKPKEKIAAIVGLLALFLVVAWPDVSLRLVFRLFLVFSIGAAVALWSGREQISIFRPTTLAAWTIIFGSLAMLWSFVMLLFVRFR
jgi:hypothetical protein